MYMCVCCISLYSLFWYNGVSYILGDSVYVPPDTHRFSLKTHTTHKPKKVPTVSHPDISRCYGYINEINPFLPLSTIALPPTLDQSVL